MLSEPVAKILVSGSWLDYLPAAALLISGLALLDARLGRRISAEALRISRAVEARQLKPLIVEVREALSSRSFEPDSRWITVELLVVNGADSGTSVSDVELVVTYSSHKATLRLRPDPGGGPPQSGQRLEVPLNLAANSSVAGYLQFRMPSTVFAQQPIDTFGLATIDSRGNVFQTQFSILREA